MATGALPATVKLRSDLVNEGNRLLASHDRPGAVTARLAQAGPALLLPDLIQNLADRPLAEVQDFFQQLLCLPHDANMESLRSAFGWYRDDFLGSFDYESDPVAGWQMCAPRRDRLQSMPRCRP